MRHNLLLLTDSYKVTHWLQYPPFTDKVYSYFESRGGDYRETVFFGLQYFIKEYLTKPITQADINEADAFFAAHLGNYKLFNRAGWEYILKEHNGYLPVKIHAVPEGTVVPTHNILMSIENTDPKCYWLTNYLETLLVQVWYPTTVATQSRVLKKLIHSYLKDTGDEAGLPFKLHDFGFRGVSSVESAGIGGAAHLVNFMGTDTMAALQVAAHYYHEPMAGFSIPAAEHSTITSWGRENEVEAFRNMINKFGNGAPGLYAVVSDSYNIYEACDKLWGQQLKAEVLAAENILVVRPDSGHPASVVEKVLNTLGNHFGYTVNSKGFKVLNKVRVIQGDGVNEASIEEVLRFAFCGGWSADNIAFGMGGALLQKLNRDTLNFAFKCSAIEVNGETRNVMKQPITSSMKVSKAGKLRLVKENGEFKTVPANHWVPLNDELIEVFRNGKLLVDYTFADIRKRASL